MKSRRPTGVVLLVSMLIVLGIAVLGRVVLSLYPGLLSLSVARDTSDKAKFAAESGLEYALSRLRETPSWKAQSPQVVIDRDELFVIEGQGNVVGLLKDSRGRLSQFRIRFNFQDGNGGPDGFNDPESSLWIDHPYVSLNNFDSVPHAALPKASGTSGQVLPPDLEQREAPGRSAHLFVEGRSGVGVQNLSPEAYNASPSGPVSVKIVEVCLQAVVETSSPHASIMAGGEVDLTVAPGGRVSMSVFGNGDDLTPRLRSKASVKVSESGGSPGAIFFKKARGEIGRDSSAPGGFQGNPTGQGADLVQENPGDGNPFYELNWNDVAQASTDPTTTDTVRLPAGTYVHWDDRTYHYYDMDFSDYQSYMANPANRADPGVLLSDNFPEIREAQNVASAARVETWDFVNPAGTRILAVGLFDDTRILPTDKGTTDFTLTSRAGAAYSPEDNSTVIEDAGDNWTHQNVALNMKNSTLSAPGDVRILAKLDAESSTITTEGDFTMASPWGKIRQDGIEPDTPYGLNLYSRGNVRISSYKAETSSFAPIVVHGLVYAWGDFECLTGHNDVPIDRWKDTKFTGTVVAYGGNPESGEPGAQGKGKVKIVSDSVGLWSDYRTLAKVVDISSAGVSVKLERTLFGIY